MIGPTGGGEEDAELFLRAQAHKVGLTMEQAWEVLAFDHNHVPPMGRVGLVAQDMERLRWLVALYDAQELHDLPLFIASEEGTQEVPRPLEGGDN